MNWIIEIAKTLAYALLTSLVFVSSALCFQSTVPKQDGLRLVLVQGYSLTHARRILHNRARRASLPARPGRHRRPGALHFAVKGPPQEFEAARPCRRDRYSKFLTAAVQDKNPP